MNTQFIISAASSMFIYFIILFVRRRAVSVVLWMFLLWLFFLGLEVIAAIRFNSPHKYYWAAGFILYVMVGTILLYKNRGKIFSN